MANATDDLLDRVVRHQVLVERFKTSELPKLIKELNALDGDLIAQISVADPASYTGKRLANMLAEVSAISDEATKRYAAALGGTLQTYGEYESGWTVANLAQVMGAEFVVNAGLNLVTPDANLLKAAINTRPLQGKLLKEWVAGLALNRRTRLTAAIRIAMIEQSTIAQLVRRIMGTKANEYRDGILNISRLGANALARTAVQHVSTEARRLSYEANKSVISEVQWVATLDSRTTAFCRAMDGKRFPLNSGPRPPAHINCRSTTVPVLKSWADIGIDAGEIGEGTRASMNGQVPDTLTYDSWLRKQTPEFQDEVLGKAKADLFRGGLTMDKFVDLKTQHEFTIDELRQREPDAWKATHGGKTAEAGNSFAEEGATLGVTEEQANREERKYLPNENGLLVGAREIVGSGASLPLALGDYGSFKAGEDAVRRYMVAAERDLHTPSEPGSYEHMVALEATTGKVLWRTTDNVRNSVNLPSALIDEYTSGAGPKKTIDLWHNHPSAMSPLSTQDMVFTMHIEPVRQIVAHDAAGNVFRGEAPHFADTKDRDAHLNWLHFGHKQWMAEFEKAIPEFDEFASIMQTLPRAWIKGTIYRDQAQFGYANHLSWRLMDELGFLKYRYETVGVLKEMDSILDQILKEEGMTLLDFARDSFNPKTVEAQLEFAARTKAKYL